MAHGPAEEAAETLLRAARKAGLSVTRAQLHRWQQAGLLPKPRQRGLGRGRGTEALYPPGSARQLVALGRQLRTRRSLDAAAWVLWWDGYRVDPERIRALLARKVVGWEALREERTQEDDAALDAWVERVDRWSRGRLPDRVVRRMRRRTGIDRFAVLALRLLDASAGNFDWFRDDEAEIVAGGVGLPDTEGLEDVLRVQAGVFNPDALREALEAASSEDLEAARDEVRGLLDLLDGVNTFVAAALGRSLDTAWVSALRRPDLTEGVSLVLLWLSLRRRPDVRRVYDVALGKVNAVSAGLMDPAEAAKSDWMPASTKEDPDA